jgi:ferrous iron transport protein A
VTVNELVIGQQATVKAFTDVELGHQLLEMGVIPGESIVLERVAPLGDPIAVRVSDVLLMMRRKEAASVIVTAATV